MSARRSREVPILGTARSSMVLDPALPASTHIETASMKIRSSWTTPDHDNAAPVLEAESMSKFELDEERTANGEHGFERCHDGGDDPQEPRLEKKATSPQEGKYLNVVTWDGPDDPANPRNWSTSYKLFITVLCCMTTLNV
jgi:hypothetical protein